MTHLEKFSWKPIQKLFRF